MNLNDTPGIIVLDGADCSGKTTLARWFIENCGARYLHLGLYKDLFMHQLAAYRLAERWASRGELVVVDRHWLSEAAYGDSLRSGALNPVSLRVFDRLFLRSVALNILCVPSDSEKHLAYFKENKERRNEMFDEVKISKVIRYYKWLAGGYLEGDLAHPVNNYAAVLREHLHDRSDYRVYDFEKDGKDLDAYCKYLLSGMDVLRSTQYLGGLDESTTNFAGLTSSASILMIGERAGGKVNYPFISRDDKLSSALWLNRALDILDVSEHDLCWVNALNGVGPIESNREISNELLDLLDEKRYTWRKVIALGQTASHHLQVCGWREGHDFVKIPHPQWARRFKYRDRAWYCKMLGEALGLEA